MYLKPKKSLGQHFLIDKNIQKKIIAACNFKPFDTVLEIGAGKGELTRLITSHAGRVFALEIDPALCEILAENLKENKNVKIINEDILNFNFKKYFVKFKNKIKVIGNIPYYITTPIIEHLLTFGDKIEIIFLTVQKEFALRMAAASGSKDYGSFSCFIQYYTTPKKLFFITRTCFRPIPKVDSCFLQLEIREEPPVKIKNKEMLFKIIRAAFNQRRKTLRNSLKGLIAEKDLERFFTTYRIDPHIRPERLGLQDFANLVNLQKL